jgi:hypothetical protein
MFVFTLFFGFLGLHHVMLRSPLTGVMFFFGNALTLGYWWMYDLIQIACTSEDDLNKYGLGFPFFIETGIAVGMWEGGTLRGKGVDSQSNPVTKYGYQRYGSGDASPDTAGDYVQRGGDSAPKPSEKKSIPTFNKEAYNERKKGDGSLKDTAGLFAESVMKVYLQWFLSKRDKQKPKEYDWDNIPPNAWITFFFLLATPFEVISSAIAGDMWACFLHCISIFPLGYFLFPVVLIRSFCVSIYTLLFPMDVFINGVTRPFPFVQLYTMLDIDGRSDNIQRSKINDVDIDANYKAFEPFIDIFKQGIGLAEGCLAYVPLAVGGAAGQSLRRFGDAAMKTAKANAILAQRAQAAPAAKGPMKGGALPVQKGGGSADSSDTMSLAILGAVVAGGLLLALGRNVVQGNNDSPPVPGRV